MKEYKIKTIRALERGLDVLEYMHNVRSTTLHELHQATGLPKATLIRIIATFEKRGIIWQRLTDKAYIASHSISSRMQYINNESYIVEAASPILSRLCEKCQWPSVLSVPRLDHMAVIETNTAQSYFSHILEGQLDFRINMLKSASGRAYLAFCSEPERKAILQRLKASKDPGNYITNNSEMIYQLLEETRRLGYGQRADDFGGNMNVPRSKSDDGRLTIAVPVWSNSEVIAVINITWNRKVMTLDKIVEKHLTDLTNAASEISTALQMSQPQT